MNKNTFTSLILFSFLLVRTTTEAQILNTDRTKSLDSSENVLSKVAVSIATDQQKKFLLDFYYSGDFTFLNKKNSTTFYSKIDKVTNGGQSIQKLSTSFNLDFLYDTNPIVPIDHFHYNYYQTLSYNF